MSDMELRAWVYSAVQLDEALDNADIAAVYAPMRLLSEKYAGRADRLILLPPEFLGGAENETERGLLRLRELGFSRALAHTSGHIGLLGRTGFEICGGSRLNCTNSEAMRFFADCGLCDIIVSTELTVQRINRLKKPIKTGFMAYGAMPLMLNRRCPVRDGRPCGGADKKCGRQMTDRKGNRLNVLCSEDSVEILNSDTLVLSDKLGDFGTDFAVLRFTYETDIRRVINAYVNGERPDSGRFTRGLYYRGVQ
ncbi:MAG: U32 family peptidase [Ruminiclostridium sp.]|nr:U32 family peptidase [Ruminiclostridium sp.]